MTKAQALRKIAEEIAVCPLCKKDGIGKAVPGEGNADAQVVFVGEAPGKEEAKTGRPFVGKSGTFLRSVMAEIGLDAQEVFITSPGHYLPLRGRPSKETIIHGRMHLFRQLEIIDPKIIVLLGSTACLAVLDRRVEISREHGKTLSKGHTVYFITFHPSYAVRFPEGRKGFLRDFQKLERLFLHIRE